MEQFEALMDSKIVILLGGGTLALIIAVIMKKGRLAEETPSVFERILWVVGILALVSGALVGMFRPDVVDLPARNEKQLKEYDREPSGCSKPQPGLKEYSKP
jgi:hypothetical protein